MELRADLTPMRDLAASFPKAAISALNKTASRVKTEASRRIRERYNIKARDVSANIRIKRARAGEPSAEVIASGTLIPLADFSPRPTSPNVKRPEDGVSVMIIKGRREIIQGAFIVKTQSGHVGVFKRLEQGFKYRHKKRAKREGRKDNLPIGSTIPKVSTTEMRGISVQQMFGNKPIAHVLDTYAVQTFEDIFPHEIEYFKR